MASITIRRLDETVKERLRARASLHGRSMEDEAREILTGELGKETGRDWVDRVRSEFAEAGYFEFPVIDRHPMRDPPFSGTESDE